MAERMPAAQLALALLLAAALAGCDRPAWTDPARSKGPRSLVTAARGPTTPGAAPALPGWAAPLMGADLKARFPGSGVCIGNLDRVKDRFAGPPAGTTFVGWGWEPGARRRIARVLIVDRRMRIIGAGDGGAPRPRVMKVVASVTDPDTGWVAVTPKLAGRVSAYGLTADGRSVCPLGQLDY